MSDIETVLARVARRRPRVIDLSLDRVFQALDRLDNPQLQLPPVFHVAGTNGKGSTVAFLRSILEASGARVHTYTSPHLVRFNERIVLSGREIEDDVLIDALEQCDRAVGDEKLTYFETVTCAAMVAFAQTPADYLVLEVGLGGRLDATNILDAPLAACVTPVDLDHQQFLGDTIALVAAEKAGIFRRDTPAVIGRQSSEAMGVLQHCAHDVGAHVFAHGEQWDVYSEHGRMTYQDDNGLAVLDPPRLSGAHQIDNAGLAVATIKAAGLQIANDIISKGIASATHPARLQRLKRGPLVEQARALFGDGMEIWLDGGHNPHAGRAVARALADMEEQRSRPLFMIAGMQSSKDGQGYFAPFAGLVSHVFTVAAQEDGVAPASEVADAARAAGLSATVCQSPEEAVAKIGDAAKKEPPRILIGGSLYLAGEVLAENS